MEGNEMTPGAAPENNEGAAPAEGAEAPAAPAEGEASAE